MYITYDPEADAAYINLTEADLTSGRATFPAEAPNNTEGDVLTDWKDGKLVGIEVIGARALLHQDLLDQARPPGKRPPSP